MALLLGIDTGGTYTDAVLFDEARSTGRVVAKAKALTTREDLSKGVGGAIDGVLAQEAEEIALVSISTTLATNALVEGQGGRVALVFIGFSERDLDAGGLREALRDDPAILIAGGHGPLGEAQAPLDLDALRARVEEVAPHVEGFAVVGHFGVRNPAHEIAARDLVREATGAPVTCGHELSADLNGPKRAVTSVLNARLIGMISELIAATEAVLEARGIAAPLMLVRGDGSLVSADFAKARPIETILSGPAASLIGAAELTGLKDAVISDIGGTTTDIAILREGRPRLSQDGATVGGHRTMVEAAAMATHGLGGDSEIVVDERAFIGRLIIGPARAIPVSLLAMDHAEAVFETLERQLRAASPSPHHGRFILRAGVSEGRLRGLSAAERRFYDALGEGPRARDEVMRDAVSARALARLLRRGLVRAGGFTPSDAAHVLGLHRGWRRDAAEATAKLFARQRDARGLAIAGSGEAVARAAIDALTRRSAEALLAAVFAEDGIAVAPETSALVAAALEGRAGAARVDIGVALPVVGLGASAPTYYPGVARALGAEHATPEDADVANAVGAVAGRVELTRKAVISQPQEGLFRAHLPHGQRDHTSLAAARAEVEAWAVAAVREAALEAGADAIEIAIAFSEKSATVEGQPMFIEGEFRARASGRPKLGAD